MAQKRMFDNSVIDQDSFMDLPSDSKALYFLLGMKADDEGFVSPRAIMRVHQISDDALRLLIAKDFVIPFPSGVIVITDWKRNNYLDKNRISRTIHTEELKELSYDEDTKKYALCKVVKPTLNGRSTTVKPALNGCLTSIVESSIEENSIENIRPSNSSLSGEHFVGMNPDNDSSHTLENDQKKRKSKKPDYSREIKDVIGFLNEKAGRSYRPDTEQTIKDLTRWFNLGYTVGQMRRMIDFKVKDWKGTDFEKYLCPSTLFRKSKFEGYVEASEGYKTTDDYCSQWGIEVLG